MKPIKTTYSMFKQKNLKYTNMLKRPEKDRNINCATRLIIKVNMSSRAGPTVFTLKKIVHKIILLLQYY